MREKIVSMIAARLEFDEQKIADKFQSSRSEVGVRYCVIDDLLPEAIAQDIAENFPIPAEMRLMDSFREKKYTSKNFDQFNPLMADITFAVQDPRILEIVGRITGIKNQVPDASLYAGGLSSMTKGHFLGPHIDNSHDGARSLYRTVNLLYYVTPDWSLENGGNLQLWNRNVRENATIVSRFNRLAIMETTPTSWHSVSKVLSEGTRRCISNYYFSPLSPTGQDYFNVTSFSAWPDQPFRRLLAKADNRLRQAMRILVPQGFGKKDVYQGFKK